MKVAVAAEGRNVAAHFGRCAEFVVARIDDGQVVERQAVACPPHQPGLLPALMRELGVEAVVCGGIGPRAQSMLAAAGIDVYAGVTGLVDDALTRLARGELEAAASLCDHDHGGHAEGHSCRH